MALPSVSQWVRRGTNPIYNLDEYPLSSSNIPRNRITYPPKPVATDVLVMEGYSPMNMFILARRSCVQCARLNANLVPMLESMRSFD